MKLYDQNGIPRDTDHMHIVEGLEQLKSASGSKPWPVIEAIFKLWQDKRPTEWNSHLFYLDDVRSSRRGRFASSNPDERGMVLRYTIDIPEFVMKAIRFLYSPDELPMNREFFLEFAKRFPKYKVAEKV